MAEQIGKNWAGFRFEEVLEATGARLFTQRQDPENLFLYTNSVVSDSRQFCGEQLFVALKGERFDGHDYVDKAAKESAVGAVVEREIEAYWPSGLRIDQFVVPDTQKALGDLARFHRKRFQIPLVAVTGSYGKTSTRALIHAALSQKFDTLTSQGNFNNEIGLPMTLFQLEEKHQAAVVEMGMRGRGQIEYLTKIAEPTVGVITNIGPQHIELLGSVEEIAAAKAELIENLPENGLAVLPADSPFLPFLTGKTECTLVTFGAAEWADYRVQNIETRPDGNISCEINRQKIHLPLPGAHNAINAAAAFAVALELGVSPEEAARGLEGAELPGARMRVEKLPNGITLIDDCYNAGPDSTRAALQTLLDFPGGGRRVAILGAMKELGEHSESEHRKIGSLAGQICDVLIGVGGETRPLLNSALESARQIESEMPVFYCDDAKEAANRVGEWLQKGDVLLVKGSRSVGLEVVVGAATNLKQ
jgi:UDP-N-acetylmuramoyl-tripeptide--D-alanyl-D-alanine ligase